MASTSQQQIEHRKNYSPLTMGLNTRFLPLTLQDEEASVLLNAQVNNDGTIEKYPGYTKYGSPFPNSASSFIRTIFDFRRGTSVDVLLIAASDSGNTNSTYKVDIKQTNGDGTFAYIGHTIGTATFTASNTSVTGTNTSWTKEFKPGDKIKAQADADSAYTEIATVNSDTSLTLVGGYLGSSHASAAYIARKISNTNNIPRMCTFNNVCIIMDGDMIPQQYNGTDVIELINSYSGTTLTQQTNPAPKGVVPISHKNRVFTFIGSTLYWSHVNDQTFWDPLSLAPIFPQDGGDIVSIVSFADSLVVLKNNGRIYRVLGNFDDSDAGTPAYILKVDYNENIGIIADRSAFVHNNYLYFLAETGVYSLDTRGFMQRISYYIEPTTNTFNFSLGAQTSKSFPFTTKTQWDSGTHSGSYAAQTGTIFSYFDDFRQTDCSQGFNLCSIAIDSSNTIHIAYVPTSNTSQINYVKYYTTGFIPTAGSNPQKETSILPGSPTTIQSLSIACDPSSGIVGLAYGFHGHLSYLERSADSGVTLGTWGTAHDFNQGSDVYSVSLQFTGGGVPGIVAATASGASSNFAYTQRNAGVWTSFTVIQGGSSSGINSNQYRVCLVFDGSANIYASGMITGPNLLYAAKSTNGGTTFSLLESFTLPSSTPDNCTITSFLDKDDIFKTGFQDASNNIIVRNHVATTSSTIESTANSHLRGFLNIARVPLSGGPTANFQYYLNIVGNSPNQIEKYVFENSSNLQNPSTNVINLSIRPGVYPLVHNKQVIASVNFGINANEIVIRRISFYGYWTGPEQHDSTLSSWGTFVITNSISNGNTLTYQIALSSAPGASTFNNIVSGQIISSNANLIYNVPRFVWTLLSWSGVNIGSIVLNYTGAGVDARQAYGISYYNEAYFAVSESGQTSNNKVLIYDFKNSPLLTSYAVNCLERFKTNLYAGSATNGDLYILKQGFDFAGSSYSMDVQTKEDILDTIELKKDFYKIYILYKVQSSGSFIFSYRFDNFTGSTDKTWTAVTIDQTNTGPGSNTVLSGEPGIAEINVGQKKAKSIQYRIQNNNAGESVQILAFALLYGLVDRR